MLITLGIAIEIYLFFMLMGWGATRLILPESTRPYQFWIAPWFGLIITDISVVWFSRLGRATEQSVYLVTLLGIALLALCKFRKVSLSVPRQKFDAIIALGSFVGLFLALAPLLAINPAPTTVSLGGSDPALYAIAGDFLRSHNINQPPPLNPNHIATLPVIEALAPGHRTGCWLVFALLASRFNLHTYQIFSLTLGVFFALTPALITIFTWVVTKQRFPALIALTLSVLNVNLLFFNYHGYAGQVLAQGCLILAFLLLYLAEQGDEPFKYYLLPLGLSISSLFTLYPEMGVFFLLPFALYLVLKLTQKNNKKINFLKNFALVLAIGVLIDPISFWHGLKYVLLESQQPAGWSMPRWAFPVDMVGLLSIHSGQNYPIVLILVASLLVLAAIAYGLYSLHNTTFWLALLTFGVGILLWLSLIRRFSYGYYKASGFLTFVIIIAFSVGLASFIIKRSSRFNELWSHFFTICIVGLFSALATLPTFQTMVASHLRVTPELANLSEVSIIAQQRKVYLDTPSPWEQLWASNFLQESRINFYHLDPYAQPLRYSSSSAVERGGLLLTRNWDQRFLSTDKLLWKNSAYFLIAVGETKKVSAINKLSAKLGKNWWDIEKWWGDQSNPESFRWMNQDGTIDIESSWFQPLQAVLQLRFVPALPKTTVDVYLNNSLIETLEVKSNLKVYSIICKLKPGNNQLRFHVREGTFQPPNDYRKIALGLIGKATEIMGESTISVQLGKNWWHFETWKEKKSDSKVFKWMNQDGTIQITNNLVQPIKTSIRFKFIPVFPKTTVDVYLNNKLLEILEVKQFKYYPVSCQLEPGDNELRFHVQEGTKKTPRDEREIALGVNAIRLVDEP
jgi:hypothetical protein